MPPAKRKENRVMKEFGEIAIECGDFATIGVAVGSAAVQKPAEDRHQPFRRQRTKKKKASPSKLTKIYGKTTAFAVRQLVPASPPAAS
jgi:hypothetical protein